MTDGTRTLILEGSVNGNLCEVAAAAGLDVPYVLRFQGVMALRLLELDSWEDDPASSFDEVLDSTWISSLGGKVDSTYRHFCVQTYDDIFDVVCQGYEFHADLSRAET
jgi:hypothetical protein